MKKYSYLDNPSFDSEKLLQIRTQINEDFSPLLEFSYYAGRRGFSNNREWDGSPATYQYVFSDGSVHEFKLESEHNQPKGTLLLRMQIESNRDINILNVEKLDEELFLVSSWHYEYSGDFMDEMGVEFLQSNDSDWADTTYEPDPAFTAPEDSLAFYEERRKREERLEISNSIYRELYESETIKRNHKVDQINFRRTFESVYKILENSVPIFKSSPNPVPSYKTGEYFERSFLIDRVNDEDIKSSQFGYGSQILWRSSKSDFAIFLAEKINGEFRSYRNQIIARIQPNGRVTWESRDDYYAFSLDVIRILEDFTENKVSIVNYKYDDLVFYDSDTHSDETFVILKCHPSKLVKSFLSLASNKLGKPLPNFVKQSMPHPDTLKIEHYPIKFELQTTVDTVFTNMFLRATNN